MKGIIVLEEWTILKTRVKKRKCDLQRCVVGESRRRQPRMSSFMKPDKNCHFVIGQTQNNFISVDESSCKVNTKSLWSCWRRGCWYEIDVCGNWSFSEPLAHWLAPRLTYWRIVLVSLARFVRSFDHLLAHSLNFRSYWKEMWLYYSVYCVNFIQFLHCKLKDAKKTRSTHSQSSKSRDSVSRAETTEQQKRAR